MLERVVPATPGGGLLAALHSLPGCRGKEAEADQGAGQVQPLLEQIHSPLVADTKAANTEPSAQPRSKTELLERMRAGREEWDALIAPVPGQCYAHNEQHAGDLKSISGDDIP
jgi:hypothetical protein